MPINLLQSMCTNQRLIYPKYSRFPIYVKCGHCPACLQEKAIKRVYRIKNTVDDSKVCIMVALTYSRGCCPYVFRSEAYDFVNGKSPVLNVYRDCSVRKVRKPSNWNDYNQVYKFEYDTYKIDSVDFCVSDSLLGTKDLKYEHGKIGICHYKDYQQFIARYRLNLKRHYKYENKFFVYACSEYGSRSQRPHFHLLIIGDKADQEKLISAIYESWPFSDLRKFPKAVQVAYRAASYVASYVNCGSKFPNFFKNYFRQKHSYSKGFGTNNSNFLLSKILQNFERGSLKYSVLSFKSGVPFRRDVPFPAYVIHRFFPKFKGYTRLSPSTLVANLQRIGRFDYDGFLENSGLVYLDPGEFYRTNVLLMNAYRRFLDSAPPPYSSYGFLEYYRLHKSIWNCFNSTLLRFQMENTDVPLTEHFDNLDTLVSNDRGRELLRLNGVDYTSVFELDPNKFRSVVNHTFNLSSSFYDHIKHRNVNASVYEAMDSNCEL